MRYKKVVFLIFGVFSALAFFATTAEADDSAHSRLISARQSVRENPDFAFMDYTMLVHDYPESVEASEAAFGIGEYYFDRRNYSAAADAFKKFLSRSSGRVEELAGLAFLVKSAELAGDKELRGTAEDTLKQRLSAKHFFMLFEDKRVQSWRSPFGRDLVIREFVDRLEVTLNGSPFYTAQLP